MAASSVERGQRGVSRILTKLENSISSGDYYEAHQMYRTLYFRYMAQTKFDECLELLSAGIVRLADVGQQSSAADLTLLLIVTLEKRGRSDDINHWIIQICGFIARLSPTTVDRETVINRAIKWSRDISGNSLGHPKMHRRIGHLHFVEGNLEQARHHFLLCQNGVLCARILIYIQKDKGFDSEIDLFIAQAVLQLLCLKDLRTAESTFIAYTTNHEGIGRRMPMFKQPLLNFIYFLFRCIEDKRLDRFEALCKTYKSVLRRDPSFENYLLKIGVIYLEAPPPPPRGGVFGDLFTRLFQGFDEDDDNDQQEENRSYADASATAQSNELD